MPAVEDATLGRCGRAVRTIQRGPTGLGLRCAASSVAVRSSPTGRGLLAPSDAGPAEVRPLGDGGRGELLNAPLVAGGDFWGRQLTPLPARAAVEEVGVVAPDPVVGVGGEI